jgi:hypothetical protein
VRPGRQPGGDEAATAGGGVQGLRRGREDEGVHPRGTPLDQGQVLIGPNHQPLAVVQSWLLDLGYYCTFSSLLLLMYCTVLA